MTMGKVPVEPQWQLPFSQRKDCVLSTCACTLHHNLRHVCACRCSSYAWVADPLPCSCRRFTPVHRSETKSKTPRPEWQAVTKSSTELCSDQKTRSRDSLNASVCEASDSFCSLYSPSCYCNGGRNLFSLYMYIHMELLIRTNISISLASVASSAPS